MSAHADPSAAVVMGLALILVAAKVGGHLAIRLKQPAVLGELLVGVLLGNLSLLGVSTFEPLEVSPFIDMFARVGVIILLFEVGLESTVGQMMKVGSSAALVALIGVATPLALGFGAGHFLLPTQAWTVHLFIGATLTATSVGITARVLKDVGKAQSREGTIIVGAAVIDDVLGLVILAVVTGVIQAASDGRAFELSEVGLTLFKALAFLTVSLVTGRFVSKRLFNFASRLRVNRVLLTFALAFAFAMAALSDLIGLAPIVGAFAAGLILEDVHYQHLKTREQRSLEELIHPLSDVLVPVFFVLMGMRVDVTTFVQPGVAGLAVTLCVVGIIGKVVAGFGVLGSGVDRLSVGIGMVPRGEVGLIFASVGAGLVVNGAPVIAPTVFAAIVAMVIVTTLVTPPLLKWSLGRKGRSTDAGAAPKSE